VTQPSGENGQCGPRRGSAVCACGGALIGGSAVTHRRHGVTGEHRWGPREASGKKSGDGAHRGGRATVGRRKAAGAAVFNGSGVAPVVVDVRGRLLQLDGDPGVRRRWSIEGKSARGGGGSSEGVTRGRSPAQRRGSGGGKQVRRTLGRWGSVCGTRAWTGETNGARGRRIRSAGDGVPFLKGADGGRNRRGVGRRGRRVEEAARAGGVPVDWRAAPNR
jgi:hypothetical protein